MSQHEATSEPLLVATYLGYRYCSGKYVANCRTFLLSMPFSKNGQRADSVDSWIVHEAIQDINICQLLIPDDLRGKL